MQNITMNHNAPLVGNALIELLEGIVVEVKQPEPVRLSQNLIAGRTWEEISAMQQKSHIPQPALRTDSGNGIRPATTRDLDLLKQHNSNLNELKNAGFFGSYEALNNALVIHLNPVIS